MTMVSLGDMAQAFMLRRQTAGVKQLLQTQLSEVTTGQAADLSRHLKGDHSALAAIDITLSRLSGYSAAGTEARILTDGMQAALESLATFTTELSSTLLAAASPGNSALMNAAAAEGRQRLETALSWLNSQSGGRSLFAGQATDGPAVADSETILTAIESAIVTAGAVSAADVEQVISDWFDDPAGYAAVAYLGDVPLNSVAVADGERADLAITANDPAIRGTLKGLAMMAVMDRGQFAGQITAQVDFIKRAGERLLNAQTPLTEVSAGLGITQAQIATATTRNNATKTSLGIARNDMVQVDPYEAAMRLQETQTQLETLYTLTARVSRLSLVDYL